jgi:selenocysteine-specific translation elongation factor
MATVVIEDVDDSRVSSVTQTALGHSTEQYLDRSTVIDEEEDSQDIIALEKQLRDLLESAGTRSHPFDLKNDDLVKIKRLFPEN